MYLMNNTHSKPQSVQRNESYTITSYIHTNVLRTHWNSRETQPHIARFSPVPRRSWEHSSSLAVLLCWTFCPPGPHQLFFILCHAVVCYFHLPFRNSSAGQSLHNLLMVHLFKNRTFLPWFCETIFQTTWYQRVNTVCYTSWKSNYLQSCSLRENKFFTDCSFLSSHLSLIFKRHSPKLCLNRVIPLTACKTVP